MHVCVCMHVHMLLNELKLFNEFLDHKNPILVTENFKICYKKCLEEMACLQCMHASNWDKTLFIRFLDPKNPILNTKNFKIC